MIIISVGCGLGNQMFEYSFYYKIKKMYPNQIVKLDINYAFPLAHNGIEIEEIFGLTSEKATLEEVKVLADMTIQGEQETILHALIRKIKRKLGFGKKSFLLQKDPTKYYPEFFKLDERRSYYLFGPFCNSLYFKGVDADIQQLFKFPTIDEKNRKWLDIINENISVSLHVRRGDYIQMDMGTLTDSYYLKAVEYINSELEEKNFVFLAFTDDPVYVKENFGWIENLYIVEGNTGKNSFRDMQLMSLCNHNIIANSTFSFWGAYLNQNPNKIVIAPKQPVKRCKYPFTYDGWIMV